MTNEETELQRRLELLENPSNQGEGFTPVDWIWLVVLGVILPVGLLIWGWY